MLAGAFEKNDLLISASTSLLCEIAVLFFVAYFHYNPQHYIYLRIYKVLSAVVFHIFLQLETKRNDKTLEKCAKSVQDQQ